MLSRAGKKGESDISDGEGSTTEPGAASSETLFHVDGVPLHYTWKVENMMTRKFIFKAHLVSIFNRMRTFEEKDLHLEITISC